MPVPFLLLDVLENLSTKELKSFKWFLGLKILKCCDPILTSYLESPLRQNTVSRMIQSYGEENAVNMTLAILRLMKLNNTAEDFAEITRRKQQLKEKSLDHQFLRLLHVLQLDGKSPLMVQLVPPLPRPQLPQILGWR
ncbi:hypothetical protein NQZ68_006244 [Dissostichus eleginoides]|nr:hypothetical protein NQZ68_006244 [Dissostichus eleginoides]